MTESLHDGECFCQPIIPPPCDKCGGETVYYDSTRSLIWFKCDECSSDDNYALTTRPR